MGEVAQAGVNYLVETVDETTEKLMEAIADLENVAVDAGHSAITVGDKTFDAAMEELNTLRENLIKSAKSLMEAVTAPLP